MAQSREVLNMLIPNGGYVAVGQDYEGIQFIECEPITKKEWQDGFAKVDAWKDEQDAEMLAAKTAAQAKLTALGLTVEDLQALGL
jgi:hypothetical protein